MRGEHELDVLEAHAFAPQAVLQRRQRRVVARPGVHERQGLAAEEPGVDRADVRQRERDGHGV